MHAVLNYCLIWLNLQKKFNEPVPQNQIMNTQSQRIRYDKMKEKKEHSNPKASQHHQTIRTQSQKVRDEKLVEIRDQVVRAKAYLLFAPPTSNSRLVKELKLRIKEIEQVVGEAEKDSDLSKR